MPATVPAHPALRYHGAKFRLAEWLLGFVPAHRVYVEPFGGAAGLLLRKPRSPVEIYNDLDSDVVNFFRVLRDPVQRAQLVEAIRLTPFSREEFENAWLPAEFAIERARRIVVRAQMGFGSAGATKGRTGFRMDTDAIASAGWRNAPEALLAAGERFQGVLVEHEDAVKVISRHDAPDALHFVDPPYLHSVRSENARTRAYAHELSDVGHEALLERLRAVRGSVLLCGYAHPIYDALEGSGWRRETRSVRAAGRAGSVMRTETLWLNPRAQHCASQPRLIA